MRGGTANCAVVLSNEEIGSPTVDEPSILVCFNQPSFAKFAPTVIPGGLIIANQDAIMDYSGKPDQVRLVKVPGNSIAQELGNDRVINMVMLGALLAQRDLITDESISAALTEIWGKERAGKLLPLNLKALERGKQAGQPA
jgi:2-oxoglutarate ferredoxin oxidoreductase subunit gamma